MIEDQQSAEAMLDMASRPPRPLKIGINLPTVEGTMAGKTASWADLLTFATAGRVARL